MSKINLTVDQIFKEVDRKEFDALKDKMESCNRMLHDRSGAGSEFLGWVNIPESFDDREINDMVETGRLLRNKAEVILVIGIGGSYLGAKALLDALSSNFDWLLKKRNRPIVIFEGQNISEDYIHELLEAISDRSLAAVVISKSGTTTETAIAFRIVREEIERRYGLEEARRRIVAVTSRDKGALRRIADEEGYKTFSIPDDVGGRYSVFTPVGLLPLATAGVDIRELLQGASQMHFKTTDRIPFEKNIAAQYAAARYLLYRHGKKIEILATYQPKLHYIAEWWKQLFAESEGKDGKGLFPVSVTYTSDLHSIGQYIQSGERLMFETVVSIKHSSSNMVIRRDEKNLDQLNYIAGKRVHEINRMAELGTMLAHVDGGVPNVRIEVERLDEYCLGELFYFFEKACGISGYALGVNPFDQPGVESYKNNLFSLLNKPGYEQQHQALQERLKKEVW